MADQLIHDVPTTAILTASSGQVRFDFKFRLFNTRYLKVTVNGTEASFVTNPDTAAEFAIYTIPTEEGGYIEFGAGRTSGDIVVLSRRLPIERITRFPEAGPVPMASVNREFDRIVGILQDVNLTGQRSIMAPLGEDGIVLPPQAERLGGRVLGFNAIDGKLQLLAKGDFKGDPGGNTMAIGLWTSFSTLLIPLGTDYVQTSGYSRVGLGAARYSLDTDQVTATASRFRQKSQNGRWFIIAEENIRYTMAGAIGDGVGGVLADGTVIPDGGTNDTVAIQALYNFLAARGGGYAFVDRRQFNVTTINIISGDIHTVGVGDGSHVHTIGAGPSRLNVFNAVGGVENPANNNDVATNYPVKRLMGLSWQAMRISGSAKWGSVPTDFNGVLTGNGIRTRWCDDMMIANVTFDHLSDSGPSIRDGLRPLVQGCTVSHVGQGIDIFYLCEGARVIGNTIRNMKVFVGINIEGHSGAGRGYPNGTSVVGNTIDGVITAGIDIIESVRTTVVGNTVGNVSGNHPEFPGYSFGIHAFGSPKTLIIGNNVELVNGTKLVEGVPTNCGVGIDIAAGSSDSNVTGNSASSCSLAACCLNDTSGTAVALNVVFGDNAFDTDILFAGNVSTRARTIFGRIPQLVMQALSSTTRNAQIIFASVLGSSARFGVDIGTNNGSRDFNFFYDEGGMAATITPAGMVNAMASHGVNGTKVVGARGAAVGKATVSAAAPTKAEFDALVGKFNLLIDRVGATAGHGLTAD